MTTPASTPASTPAARRPYTLVKRQLDNEHYLVAPNGRYWRVEPGEHTGVNKFAHDCDTLDEELPPDHATQVGHLDTRPLGITTVIATRDASGQVLMRAEPDTHARRYLGLPGDYSYRRDGDLATEEPDLYQEGALCDIVAHLERQKARQVATLAHGLLAAHEEALFAYDRRRANGYADAPEWRYLHTCAVSVYERIYRAARSGAGGEGGDLAMEVMRHAQQVARHRQSHLEAQALELRLAAVAAGWSQLQATLHLLLALAGGVLDSVSLPQGQAAG